MAKQEMTWNSNEQAYFGTTSDGKHVRVEGDEFAEAGQEGTPDVELYDPDVWCMLFGSNPNVDVEFSR